MKTGCEHHGNLLTNVVEACVAEVRGLLPECRGPILECAHARLHRRVLRVRRPRVADDPRGGLAVPRGGGGVVGPPDHSRAWKKLRGERLFRDLEDLYNKWKKCFVWADQGVPKYTMPYNTHF